MILQEEGGSSETSQMERAESFVKLCHHRSSTAAQRQSTPAWFKGTVPIKLRRTTQHSIRNLNSWCTKERAESFEQKGHAMKRARFTLHYF